MSPTSNISQSEMTWGNESEFEWYAKKRQEFGVELVGLEPSFLEALYRRMDESSHQRHRHTEFFHSHELKNIGHYDPLEGVRTAVTLAAFLLFVVLLMMYFQYRSTVMRYAQSKWKVWSRTASKGSVDPHSQVVQQMDLMSRDVEAVSKMNHTDGFHPSNSSSNNSKFAVPIGVCFTTPCLHRCHSSVTNIRYSPQVMRSSMLQCKSSTGIMRHSPTTPRQEETQYLLPPRAPIRGHGLRRCLTSPSRKQPSIAGTSNGEIQSQVRSLIDPLNPMEDRNCPVR